VDAHHTAVRAFAWGGAALFAASLAYFLYTYAVTFGEIASGEPGALPVFTDIALFSVFALHHSVFARNRVRAFVRARVPTQLERSVYVWVASLMLIGVCYGWRAIPGVLWQVQAPWSWATLGVQMSGAWLTLRSAAVIDGLELAGVRQVSTPNAQLPTPNEFRAEGPYGWVRHPIYLGWILIVFGVATMTMTRLVFAAVSTVYLLIAIPLEERTLRANSGGAYDHYVRRVPWKLLPRVY
jgi:protein-S-isoprenylcysteine O-methyltransferase Ste14